MIFEFVFGICDAAQCQPEKCKKHSPIANYGKPANPWTPHQNKVVFHPKLWPTQRFATFVYRHKCSWDGGETLWHQEKRNTRFRTSLYGQTQPIVCHCPSQNGSGRIAPIFRAADWNRSCTLELRDTWKDEQGTHVRALREWEGILFLILFRSTVYSLWPVVMLNFKR